MEFTAGHIDPFWDDSFKKFKFTRQPLMDSEIEKWESMGYNRKHVKSFSGSMYDNRNPMPDWIKKLDDQFDLKNQTYNFYKMTTGEIMPPHSDHYQTYQRLFGATPDKTCRVLLMLEDWKPGHYLEINGQPFLNWRAGDWFKWVNDCPHAAANIGVEDRYTLQITGEIIPVIEVPEPPVTAKTSLHWYNFRDIETKEETVADYELKILPRLTGVDPNRPMFIYLGNGYIRDLENLEHSATDKKILGLVGVHIFLYEPICSYIDGQRHNQQFFSEYPFETDPATIRVEEFESIKSYIELNGLSKDKVVVHTCEYGVEKYFPYYNNDMTLVCDDLMLKEYARFTPDENYFFSIKKKFICTTWRYAKHRHLITAYLSQCSATYNWFFKCKYSTLRENLWFELDEWRRTHSDMHDQLMRGVDHLNEYAAISLDIHGKIGVEVKDPTQPYYPDAVGYNMYETPVEFTPKSAKLATAYYESFCAVVCETRYAQHAGNFSEKVFQAIQYKRPFILVAPPNTLAYYKSLGFESFSDFWSEEYDDEPNHEQRLIKIFELIDTIEKMPHNEVQKLYSKMRPVIEHNYKKLVSIMKKPRPRGF